MADSSTLVDRVKIFVESSGTGPFQLGNALPSFRGSEALTDGLTYSYAVESGSDYEVGQGVYVLAVDQLIRTPTLSSAGGAPVSFPANVAINFTALAADLVAGQAGTGTVTSIQGSGGTTGLTLTGGPITGAGTLTLGGTLGLANGGTGGTTGPEARVGIGLGNVDNTSDANKPVSAATQAALDALANGLAGAGGAADVGYQAPGTGAALVTVEDIINYLPILVDSYRQTGDTSDTPAFNRAIAQANAVGGGDVVASPRDYTLSGAIELEGSYDHSPRLVLDPRTVITQTAANEPVVLVGDTDYYRGGGIIGDGKLHSASGAGHVIEFGQYGAIVSTFEVDLQQDNTGKAVVYARFPNGGPSDAGLFANRFGGNDWSLPSGLTSTVHGFDVICYGTRFNENIISPKRVFNAAVEQFFRISNSGPNTWLTTNRIASIDFQICPGGGVVYDSAKGWTLEDLSFWDAGTYVNHLIEMAAGSGYESANNTLRNIARNGDALAGGIQDIKITSGEFTTVQGCYTQFGDAPRYDFGNKRVAVIGILVGTITNAAGTDNISGSGGMLKFPTCTAWLNYYDEGTWTATMIGSGANPTTPVTVTGQWTRAGRLVNISAEFANVNTTGGSGNIAISGIPFATNGTHAAVGATAMQGFGTAPGVARAEGTLIFLFDAAARTTNITYAAGGGPGAGKYLSFNISYIV